MPNAGAENPGLVDREIGLHPGAYQPLAGWLFSRWRLNAATEQFGRSYGR